MIRKICTGYTNNKLNDKAFTFPTIFGISSPKMTMIKKIPIAATVEARLANGKIGAKYSTAINAVTAELKILTTPLPNNNAEEY